MNIYYHLPLLLIVVFGAQISSAQTSRGLTNTPTARSIIRSSKYTCLPPDVDLDTVVALKQITLRDGTRVEKETVRQRLTALKAICKSGSLVDRKGRKIRFYNLQGCWGNPPADYLEILERQKTELQKLKRSFTVIEITCNSSGLMPF